MDEQNAHEESKGKTTVQEIEREDYRDINFFLETMAEHKKREESRLLNEEYEEMTPLSTAEDIANTDKFQWSQGTKKALFVAPLEKWSKLLVEEYETNKSPSFTAEQIANTTKLEKTKLAEETEEMFDLSTGEEIVGKLDEPQVLAIKESGVQDSTE